MAGQPSYQKYTQQYTVHPSPHTVGSTTSHFRQRRKQPFTLFMVRDQPKLDWTARKSFEGLENMATIWPVCISISRARSSYLLFTCLLQPGDTQSQAASRDHRQLGIHHSLLLPSGSPGLGRTSQLFSAFDQNNLLPLKTR